ncbi:MAG: Gfo/Idh/MocA family oxidoreductase [Ancalomicrobiaceae bacterium]|nr:Gfo/Idh/MocA family oxidoreductase [Ancalomicrobiaceae bacterium]
MAGTVSWGVLSTANIGMQKVIPAMLKGKVVRVDAIASRNTAKAKAEARRLGIGKAYGSYEELLADPDIEAIYNPLPNHLHVPWTIKALQAGKHVLCEKPIGMNAEEAKALIAARDKSGKIVAEAFMVRHHPQWQRARRQVQSGRIGEVRAIHTAFCYFNDDPDNVRNQADIGGGGLLDIGCYAVTTARYIFGGDPERAIGLLDRDPKFGTDRLTSGIVAFSAGRRLTFTCSTQLSAHQRVQILGTEGRIEVEIPFNAPPDSACRIFIDDGRDLRGGGISTESFPVCDQYTLQGDAVSRAILGEEALEFGIEDGIANMAVLDALFRSDTSGTWEKP